jgi:prevent-host-death family protein
MTTEMIIEVTSQFEPAMLAGRWREEAMATVWQAAEARHRFSEIVDAAVQGEAQFVKRRDGKEVVVVSREYFDKTRPTLKSYLLDEGFAEEGEDVFDQAMQDIRREGSPFIIPGRADLGA